MMPIQMPAFKTTTFLCKVFLFFGSRQKGQKIAVLLFHKPLSLFDHFAWKFRVLEFGHWTSVFTVTFVVDLSQPVGRLFHYLFLQSNCRFSIFSLLNFFHLSRQSFRVVILKGSSWSRDLMNSSFMAFKCDQRTNNEMNAHNTWGKRITTNFTLKIRRYSATKFPWRNGHGWQAVMCFLAYQKQKNLLKRKRLQKFQTGMWTCVSIVMLRHAGTQPWETFIVRDHSW